MATAEERRAFADRRLYDARAARANVDEILDEEARARRDALRMRLRAERGRTYVYKNPDNITSQSAGTDPSANFVIVMPNLPPVISRPPGWGDSKKGKQERRRAKGKAGGGFGAGGGLAGGGQTTVGGTTYGSGTRFGYGSVLGGGRQGTAGNPLNATSWQKRAAYGRSSSNGGGFGLLGKFWEFITGGSDDE